MTKSERAKLNAAKSRAKKAAEEAKAAKKVRGEVGEFGFRINTLNHKFCTSIAKKAKTMAEIKKEAWNKKGQTFYDCFKKLQSEKIAKKTKDGAMIIVKSSLKRKAVKRK